MTMLYTPWCISCSNLNWIRIYCWRNKGRENTWLNIWVVLLTVHNRFYAFARRILSIFFFALAPEPQGLVFLIPTFFLVGPIPHRRTWVSVYFTRWFPLSLLDKQVSTMPGNPSAPYQQPRNKNLHYKCIFSFSIWTHRQWRYVLFRFHFPIRAVNSQQIHPLIRISVHFRHGRRFSTLQCWSVENRRGFEERFMHISAEQCVKKGEFICQNEYVSIFTYDSPIILTTRIKNSHCVF